MNNNAARSFDILATSLIKCLYICIINLIESIKLF